MSETPIEQAQRLVTDGQDRLERQRRLVASLEESDNSQLLADARDLLCRMEETQRVVEEQLAAGKRKTGAQE